MVKVDPWFCLYESSHVVHVLSLRIEIKDMSFGGFCILRTVSFEIE